MARLHDSVAGHSEPVSEIDLRAIGAALRRRHRLYVVPTILAFVLIGIYVNVATKRYTAQSQILLENQETFFTRPDRVNVPSESLSQLDETAVASQVQLIGSPDLARRAITALKLAGNDEFDPAARSMNPISRVLVLMGLLPDPTRESPETRIVDTFLLRLTVFSPPKTRVITVEFTSRDAALAARAANTIADLYIKEQSAAKRSMAQAAAEALSAQIVDLRAKLANADAERERYRSTSGLLAGTNNMTISGQQLADINSDLSRARSIQADAQAKASMIRELLHSGKAADVAEVTNNEIVRRIWDQRSLAQAQLALESRTLLPGHPRIKELTAQVAQYDATLKSAARQAAATLENEAKIAGQRVGNLEAVLNQQKQAAGVANGDEVHLRALERIAQSYKDQLESSTTKYEEALARQSSTATPADARIISRAVRPQLPSYPKKIPFIAFGTIAMLVFSAGYVVAAELLSGRASVDREVAASSCDERQGVLPFETHPQRRVADPAGQLNAVTSASLPAAAPANRPAETGARSWFPHSLLRAKGNVRPGVADDMVFAPVQPGESVSPDGGTREKLGRIAMLAAALAYLKHFGRSAAQSSLAAQASDARASTDTGSGWSGRSSEPGTHPFDATAEMVCDNAEEIVARLVEAHVPGRGLQVVAAGISPESGASDRLIALGRRLAEKGRSLIVDLGTTPMRLADLSDPQDGRVKIMALAGLSELLAGAASFAEVIHRDCASRLHFIPTGLGDADFRDFDLILDALSETYDFIVLLTPAFPHSEIAKVMAPYADFVVLTTPGDPDRALLQSLEAELIEAGAREVLVAEPSVQQQRAAEVA